MNEPNLVPYLGRLTAKEKAVLLRLIQNLPDGQHHHMGTLPFISVGTAMGACGLVAAGGFASEQWKTYSKYANVILAKLGKVEKNQGSIKFRMHLNPKKVYRQFGRSPERGKPLNFLPKVKVTVGVKYSLPYKDYLPDKDVLVAPSVAVKPVGNGMWEVTAPGSCSPAIMRWLVETCQ